jgi:predicted dienelactone hydrolase
VVVAPTHADSIELRRRQGETVTPRQAVAGAMTPDALAGRVRDVRFLLDALPLLEEKVPALRGRVDRKVVGMAGHSMGAMTGQALAGARIAGAIYVSCSGRGGPHFGGPSAEALIVQHALGDVPLVGFFAAGEIAHHRLYGYTGVLTVFTDAPG